jgi:uncharacterized protein with HEPN domain
MKDDRLYVVYILECVSRIEQYTAEGKEIFLHDSKTQDAVLRNLHTLAEATRRISPATKAAQTEVDWEKISGFRNVLVHDYLGVNLIRVWEVVEHHLPELRRHFAAILQQLEKGT